MPLIDGSFRTASARRSVSDPAHSGDIVGALGRVESHDVAPRRSWRARLVTLGAVMGPGVIVMAGDNDAGGISVYAQAGRQHGLSLVWLLVALVPVLMVNQEMAARLGAVTGMGHARLIVERFGRLWGAFSLGDLLIVNLLTIVTEFIGVTLALGYFGVSRYLAVPVAAVAIGAAAGSGSFRRWERVMYVLLAGNLPLVPLVILAQGSGHPLPVASQITGSSGGGLLLVLALVGTTLAPWQLFFQQSNVVDKRITSRWLSYERIDTALGAMVLLAGAVAVLSLGASLHGYSSSDVNAGGVASALGDRFGSGAGDLFALVLLNASILGAVVVGLASSYAVGEFAHVKHSLHRRRSDAPWFHGVYLGGIALGAAAVLIPGVSVGAVTTAVQALAGVLLPSASVFLLLLCNDRAVLGPWTNPRWLNVLGALVVAGLVVLSGTLTLTTVLPDIDPVVVAAALGGLAGLGQLAWVIALWGLRWPAVCEAQTPWQRATWTMPAIESIAPRSQGPAQAIGLWLLRGYLVIAVGAVIVRGVSLAVG